jgi:aromatic-L-amino-acid/L-tryptophan decarboxylase
MDKTSANARLELTPEEMRALGYRVVDMLVEHFAQIREKQVTRKASREAMEERLREPAPQQGTDVGEVLAQLEQDVLSNIMHLDHPRFFAFVPSPSNFVSVMGDALAVGFNVFASTWLESSGPTEIELVTVDWLRQLCGLPDTAGGLFVSGGSMANLTALATARQIRLQGDMTDAVVYYSDQTHSSNERALRILGFQPNQMRRLPSDEQFRLSFPEVQRAVAADRAAGLRPFCLIANAGTTNTGAVDPLPEPAEFCRNEGLWLHVDGAYGAASVLCEQGRSLLPGLELADSLAIDPHKWLFQPYEIGCVLVRDSQWLRETFHILPEYLKDIERAEEEVNFCDYGVQLTRYSRALKLWMSLKVFGLEAFRQTIAHGIEQAELAEQVLRSSPCWQVVTPAQLGIVTFRYIVPDRSPEEIDALNLTLMEKLIASGFAMLSSTMLRGRVVLRLCTINPRTTEADIRETIQRLERYVNR